MHDKHIVYRDIKPENILVDMEGHIRIADFGLSKVIPPNEKSYSFCGSPEFLAPEMLQSQEGHDRRLDIFCLGVLLYEMLTGLPPFYDEDHSRMFERVLYEEPILNQSYLSSEVKKMLSMMLAKEPASRYQSIDEVMRAAWFSDIDWKEALNKQLKPPLVPDVNSSYFDDDDPEARAETNNSTFQRRERDISLYYNSTLQQHSVLDESASFHNYQSQARRLFSGSGVESDQNGESFFMSRTNSQAVSSMVDLHSKQLMIRQAAGRASQLSAHRHSQFLHSEDFDNCGLPQVHQVEHDSEMECDPAQAFADFDFSEPPLAEIQILRVLESSIQRKKKAQTAQAIQFKQNLIKKQMLNKRVEQKRLDDKFKESFDQKDNNEERIPVLVKRSLSDRHLPLDSDNEQEEDSMGPNRKPGLRDCLVRKGQSELKVDKKHNFLSSSLTKLERNMAANRVVPRASTGQTVAEEFLSQDNRISKLVAHDRQHTNQQKRLDLKKSIENSKYNLDFLSDSRSASEPSNDGKPDIASLDEANRQQAKMAHTLSSNMSEPEEMPEPKFNSQMSGDDQNTQQKPASKVLIHPSSNIEIQPILSPPSNVYDTNEAGKKVVARANSFPINGDALRALNPSFSVSPVSEEDDKHKAVRDDNAGSLVSDSSSDHDDESVGDESTNLQHAKAERQAANAKNQITGAIPKTSVKKINMHEMRQVAEEDKQEDDNQDNSESHSTLKQNSVTGSSGIDYFKITGGQKNRLRNILNEPGSKTSNSNFTAQPLPGYMKFGNENEYSATYSIKVSDTSPQLTLEVRPSRDNTPTRPLQDPSEPEPPALKALSAFSQAHKAQKRKCDEDLDEHTKFSPRYSQANYRSVVPNNIAEDSRGAQSSYGRQQESHTYGQNTLSDQGSTCAAELRMLGSHSFNQTKISARANYFTFGEFGSAPGTKSPQQAENYRPSNPLQRKVPNTSEKKNAQNPLESALFQSKTHMTGAGRGDEGSNHENSEQVISRNQNQNQGRSCPSESDPDITVENFEATLSSRQVTHVSQQSGSQRHILQRKSELHAQLNQKMLSEVREAAGTFKKEPRRPEAKIEAKLAGRAPGVEKVAAAGEETKAQVKQPYRPVNDQARPTLELKEKSKSSYNNYAAKTKPAANQLRLGHGIKQRFKSPNLMKSQDFAEKKPFSSGQQSFDTKSLDKNQRKTTAKIASLIASPPASIQAVEFKTHRKFQSTSTQLQLKHGKGNSSMQLQPPLSPKGLDLNKGGESPKKQLAHATKLKLEKKFVNHSSEGLRSEDNREDPCIIKISDPNQVAEESESGSHSVTNDQPQEETKNEPFLTGKKMLAQNSKSLSLIGITAKRPKQRNQKLNANHLSIASGQSGAETTPAKPPLSHRSLAQSNHSGQQLKNQSVSPTHQHRKIFDYAAMAPASNHAKVRPPLKQSANLASPKGGKDPQGPWLKQDPLRRKSLQKTRSGAPQMTPLNDHITQLARGIAASPSNAATDNYFKGYTKPKPSLAKGAKNDLEQSPDGRPRLYSGGKPESARSSKKASHGRSGTAGAQAASQWGLHLISTQLQDPKQPSRQQKSNTSQLSSALQKKKTERNVPVVQIDQSNFLKSKRSVDKIERAQNMMFADLAAEKSKPLVKQKQTTFSEEEFKSGSGTGENRKPAASSLMQKKKSLQLSTGPGPLSQMAKTKQTNQNKM